MDVDPVTENLINTQSPVDHFRDRGEKSHSNRIEGLFMVLRCHNSYDEDLP
jgi:hypothetical protein